MLNLVSCAAAFDNTGFARCTFNPREIVGALLVSPTFAISETDAEDLQTFLENAVKNPVKSERVLPVLNFVGVTDNSEEPVRETLGYGTTKTIRDGNYNWTFRFVKGGLCLLKSLQSFNGQDVYVIFIDAAGNLIGTKTTAGLAGIPVDDYWANKWSASDGNGATTNLSVYFSFRPVYINERLSFIQTSTIDGFDISVIKGLQDLEIKLISATASTVVVQVADKCTGSVNDIADMFSDELEDPAAWVAVSLAGDDETIDDVEFNSTTKQFTITFDPVRTVATSLNLAPTDDLEDLGVVGYEGKAITVPVTTA